MTVTMKNSLFDDIELDFTQDAVVIDGVSKIFTKPRPFFGKFLKKSEEKPEKSTEVRAVDNVSLVVKRCEIVGILGANGSGKSTLIRMISTLLLPDEGQIRVFGYDVIKDERMIQRLINRVSVEASFFKKLSPMENLLYAARLYNMPGDEARTKIKSILTRLGIKPDRIDAPLENMSRGMQQKVAIARAFLTSPIVLLLDEPTTGLDPRSKIDVQNFVNELRDKHEATILITTHDMDEAEALCDRVAIIDQGRMMALGKTEDLKREVGRLMGREESATMNEVFIHYTATRPITAEDIKRYGSWEKAFEALEAEREEEE
ncbi:ABC transporter ATP-binding protein [Ktedonobacter racemifer]|uniref:ABC transporter related protein n=1 Tax=Ktedonobacter racemifer DSM 44963 TaxID=485913 RepID=D6TKK1_KTERA|nr:ABC transporter ATP-binding protein [Ktedonobacter racemifer]EFH86301.1 ABC transporter related protein [Ktedonobacter racemifer DSM 44963]